MTTQFIIDIQKIRESARKKLASGAVTEHYSADVNTVVELLNDALATELICVLRYKNHHYKAIELGASVAAAEFLQHANEEQGHADILAERITQLGRMAKMSPDFISAHSHADYVECDTIDDMLKENLVAERIAIETYREVIKYIGNDDPTTRRLLEDILAMEEEHADDLLALTAEYKVSLADA